MTTPKTLHCRRQLFLHRQLGRTLKRVIDGKHPCVTHRLARSPAGITVKSRSGCRAPDHLHCIWTLPPGDADFSSRWRKIKAIFSRQLPKIERRSASRLDKGERGIWQRRFWEHALRDETDWQRHVDYIHYNPVEHGHVKQVAGWPYSTFHRYVRFGLYPRDWAGTGLDAPDQFGEG